MEKYRYSDEELAMLEKSPIPFAIYQFLNRKVVTIVVSQGLIDLMGLTGVDKKEVVRKKL